MSSIKKDIENQQNDDIYASVDLAASLPKSVFPEHEHNPRNIFNSIRDELMLDGNSRQNLATFCQTWVEQEVRDLMDLSIDKNMIDKDEYPQTAEIEARCVMMLADLWHSPSPESTLGCSTIGSSEAAMLGGLALKWQWRKKRASQGNLRKNPISFVDQYKYAGINLPVILMSNYVKSQWSEIV